MITISVTDLSKRMQNGTAPFLFDVREADEREISVLADQLHISMAEVPQRISQIPKDQEVVVYCRTGGRSGKVIEYLTQAGYTNLVNLEGGINEYAKLIDTSLSIY